MKESESVALLVDDQPEHLRLMQSFLSREGLTFMTASDGQQALELCHSFAPQIVFSDVNMPNLEGTEFCRRLRENLRDEFCFVTLTSSDSSPECFKRCLDAGADLFLSKPHSGQDLLACLRSARRVEHLQRRLKAVALADPLTGLPTRAHFDVTAQREFERAKRHRLKLACAVLDADFFKNINDVHGHAAGDSVLRELAAVLSDTIRLSDFACRFGGEEFCVLLPETDEEGAQQWADRLRQRIESTRIAFEGKELRVTGSIGVAELTSECRGPLDLFVRADQALLLAKQSGRNRVVTHNEVVRSNVTKEIATPSKNDQFWNLPAEDVMTLLVATLTREESLKTAAELFLRFRINAAPVVDDQGNLEGILSEKDIMSRMVRCGVWETAVAKAMGTNVVSYDVKTPIRVVHAFLCRSGIRRVVIMRDGQPCGIIGRGTLLRAYRNWADRSGVPGSVPGLEPRDAIETVIDSLVAETHQLQSEFYEQPSDLTPALIHGVSRIQELSKDLLVGVRADATTSDAIHAD
ncbi:MAG: diguanylate cyclase [Pirellulales bacterium]|nr:diguanylate cyclase [Pirellulales bacterium]